MSFEAYSFCPAGTGKKVKFCCPNNWQDLDKISRMIEGGQLRAALQFVDQLLAKQPERACLWTYKTVLERASGNYENTVAAVDEFLSRFPNNPVALAERALSLLLQGDAKSALPVMEQSLHASFSAKAPLTSRQVQALILVLRKLSDDGEWPPVLYWSIWIEQHIPSMVSDIRPIRLRMMEDPQQPLRLRESPVMIPISVKEDSPPEFRRLASAINSGLLTEARRMLCERIQSQPEEPLSWYLLGMCSLWQADYVTAGESLLRYSELTDDEDMAVEAKVLSYHLKKDPWGDAEDSLSLTYALPDPAGVKEAILSDRRIKVVDRSLSPEEFGGGPPPELVAIVFRKECPAEGSPLPTELKSEAVAILMYFGRQTDRDAQLQFTGVMESDQAFLEDTLRQWLGEREPVALDRVVIGRRSNLTLTAAYVLQSVLPDRQTDLFRRLLKEVWADRPNKALDDLTPRQAATDPGKRRALKAVIEWMRDFDSPELDIVLEELKTEWNLQDGAARPSARMEGDLRVPVTVAARVDPAALSDEEAGLYCLEAVTLGIEGTADRLAQEVVARRERIPAPIVFEAYRYLIRQAEDVETAKRMRDEAAALADQAGFSHSAVHLELATAGILDAADARAELLHLAEAHHEEPEVREFLQAVMRYAASQSSEEGPSSPAPAESPGLWTPDSGPESSPSHPESKSKLWIPGQD
ncbi:hypothetical protein [Thermopirellula anaerolimosa]